MLDLVVGNGVRDTQLINTDCTCGDTETGWRCWEISSSNDCERLYEFPDGAIARAADELLVNSGTGTFTALDLTSVVSSANPSWRGVGTRSEYDWACATLCVAIHDMDNDGRNDIVLGRDHMCPDEVWMQNAAGDFAAVTLAENRVGEPKSLAVGDLNVDGYADIAFAQRQSNFGEPVVVYMADGTGGFDLLSSESALVARRAGTANGVAIGDVTGDNHPDVFIVNDPETGGTNQLYINRAAPGFTASSECRSAIPSVHLVLFGRSAENKS